MRERVIVDLDADVAAILRKHAAEAHVSAGEILDRAVRAYDLRRLLARLQASSDLDEDKECDVPAVTVGVPSVRRTT